MPKRLTRSGCIAAAAVGSALVAVWYSARFSGPWSAHDASFHIALTGVGVPNTVALWQHKTDPSRIAVIWTGSSNPQVNVLYVDRANGRQQRTTATFDELRTAYQPFEDAHADREVEVRFDGIDIPRPRPYLFGYPEPSGPGIDLQQSLFGSVTVVDRVTRRVLLTRTLVNGDRIPSPFELARVAPIGGGLALIDCLPGSDWNIWMFDRPQKTEKP